MATIGFIGLGKMGVPMARNLHDAGHDLVLYDADPDRVDAVDGDPADNPRAVTERSNVVITMVPDDTAIETVLYGKNGVIKGLDGDTTVIQMSTISMDATQEAADAVTFAGATFIDAPVSGTVGPAEDGTLTVLASGSDEAVVDVSDILDAMGDPVLYCGDTGQGTAMKLFINLLLGTMMESFAEALAFGRKQGLDTDKLFEVIDASPLSNTMFDVKGAKIRDRDFSTAFPVKYVTKDLSLALDAAQDLDLPLPATAASREATQAAKAMGYGDEDMAAIIKWLEELGDVTVE